MKLFGYASEILTFSILGDLCVFPSVPSVVDPTKKYKDLCYIPSSTVPMSRIFPLPAAHKHDTAVDGWFDARPGELGTIAKRWFDTIRSCGDDVRELLHDGHPTACVGDVAFAYVNAFTAHVNVGFFNGAGLPDPAGLLKGTGKFMRHAKLIPGTEFDDMALSNMIHAAYSDTKGLLNTD